MASKSEKKDLFKKIYYLSKILEFKNNAMKIWGVMRELIGKIRNNESSLPKRLVIEKKKEILK